MTTPQARNFLTFREMIQQNNFVVLDTETTGLKRPAEIVQIAILDFLGKPLLDTLVRPKLDIPPDAIAIHHITNEAVADAPIWPSVKEVVVDLIHGKDVIVYNATYDRHMMHSSDENWSLPKTDYKVDANWYCAMEWFAQNWGVYNEYYGSFRWEKLERACAKFGLETIFALHSALGDADLTLKLVQAGVKELARMDVLDQVQNARRPGGDEI